MANFVSFVPVGKIRVYPLPSHLKKEQQYTKGFKKHVRLYTRVLKSRTLFEDMLSKPCAFLTKTKSITMLTVLLSRACFFQAIAQCIAAAGCLFQALHQKELMRAAKFGNSFLQVSNIIVFCIVSRTFLCVWILLQTKFKNAELRSRQNFPKCLFCVIILEEKPIKFFSPNTRHLFRNF